MAEIYLLVLCTCPTDMEAKHLATLLVEQKLAACVNIVPHLQSVYTWQGKLETQTENLLIIKTMTTLYSSVENLLTKEHSYDTPEIIAFPITHGKESYLQWIKESVIKA